MKKLSSLLKSSSSGGGTNNNKPANGGPSTPDSPVNHQRTPANQPPTTTTNSQLIMKVSSPQHDRPSGGGEYTPSASGTNAPPLSSAANTSSAGGGGSILKSALRTTSRRLGGKGSSSSDNANVPNSSPTNNAEGTTGSGARMISFAKTTTGTMKNIISSAAGKLASSSSSTAGLSSSTTSSSSSGAMTTSSSPANSPEFNTEVSLENLDDFSLMHLVTRRLFAATSSTSSSLAVLVVRLLKPSRAAATSTADGAVAVADLLVVSRESSPTPLGNVEVFNVRGVRSSGAGASLKMTTVWDHPLGGLLTIREKQMAVTLHFEGGKERRLLPASKPERDVMVYCLTRLAREFAGNDKVTDQTGIDFVLSAPDVSLKCPLLEQRLTRRLSFHLNPLLSSSRRGGANNASAEEPAVSTPTSSASSSSASFTGMRKRGGGRSEGEEDGEEDSSSEVFALVGEEDERISSSAKANATGSSSSRRDGPAARREEDDDEEDEGEDEVGERDEFILDDGRGGNWEEARSAVKRRVPTIGSREESEVLSRALGEVLASTTKGGEPNAVTRLERDLDRLEADVLSELMMWENGKTSKPLTPAMTTTEDDRGMSTSLRMGDPVALLARHLERMDEDLATLEQYYAEIADPIAVMRRSIREIEYESARLESEIKLRAALGEKIKAALLDTRLSPAQTETLRSVAKQSGRIQLACEEGGSLGEIASGTASAAREAEEAGGALVRALKALRSHTDLDPESVAVKETSLELSTSAREFVRPLVDLIAQRVSYYYTYEEVGTAAMESEGGEREAHRRLVGYAGLVGIIGELSVDSLLGVVGGRYAQEAGALLRRSLTACLTTCTTSSSSSSSSISMLSPTTRWKYFPELDENSGGGSSISASSSGETLVYVLARRHHEEVRRLVGEPVWRCVRGGVRAESRFARKLGLTAFFTLSKKNKKKGDSPVRPAAEALSRALADWLSTSPLRSFHVLLPVLASVREDVITSRLKRKMARKSDDDDVDDDDDEFALDMAAAEVLLPALEARLDSVVDEASREMCAPTETGLRRWACGGSEGAAYFLLRLRHCFSVVEPHTDPARRAHDRALRALFEAIRAGSSSLDSRTRIEALYALNKACPPPSSTATTTKDSAKSNNVEAEVESALREECLRFASDVCTSPDLLFSKLVTRFAAGSHRVGQGEILEHAKAAVEEVTGALSGPGEVARGVAGLKARIDAAFSDAQLRRNVFLLAREVVVNSYWRLAEVAAGELGISIVPRVDEFKESFFY